MSDWTDLTAEEVRRRLEDQSRGEYGAEWEFKQFASEVSERVTMTARRDLGQWQVLIALGYPQGDLTPVMRVIGLSIVPRDAEAIPVGGLSVRRAREAVDGLGEVVEVAEASRYAHLMRTADAVADRFDEEGRCLECGRRHKPRPIVKCYRARTADLVAKRPQARGMGEAFYAQIALDAIEEAARDPDKVVVRLHVRYLRSDPRPVSKRKKAITESTVTGWIHTARHKYGFLAPTSQGSVNFADTEALAASIQAQGESDED